MTREEKERLRSQVCSEQEICLREKCPAYIRKSVTCCASNGAVTDEELDACIQRILAARETKAQPDMVNSPKHYELPGGLEVIDVELATQGREAVMEHCICAALEYLLRHKRKNGTEDVKKAHWWLTKYVELEAGRDE